MRIPRIYQTQPLAADSLIMLSDDAVQHVARVLRMQPGQQLELFNGDGHFYSAEIVSADKRQVQVQVQQARAVNNESPLAIHLGQGISRGDRMDFVLQKSVELGVASITPLFTERCGVKLSGDRLEKKQQQWQKIVIAACEQSGRAVVPEVHPAVSINQWFEQASAAVRLTLDPYAPKALRELPLEAGAERTNIQLLIGPEGGLTDAEVEQAKHSGFLPVRLGPRVLRTETAALTALSILQYEFGDLA
ncbi:16S rRNA m(3)U-1498 methyltransferase [Pseudidiomarina planktonica]|uniref:Ribosomal RNA small subunit methyltransferase E n=1 Tax=Pseudidiomarina planktonica TaxID=1323738 RepID=A0A1Y6G321_9GAMM|nr:16S rRNA (uracil(1498)-N(3))-methyltransferase [Pseudidiomarina planktonica]RUO63424.1 16S rRNA (uracil(1498)-N(3))-methyltransferase [Pseudidiomarina planktonica]SMQ80336.1 16S rRNA m(3)U-1498 methyltransferase [Pseudidiomarina planktonica]